MTRIITALCTSIPLTYGAAPAGTLDDQAVDKLFASYIPWYKPPSWVKDDKGSYLQYLDSATVYYDRDYDSALVLAKQREPTNLYAEKEYNPAVLQVNLGYAHGAYDVGSQNIAIYTHTPVRRDDGTDLHKSLHIIHAIAPGLDSAQQPDYKYIASLPQAVRPAAYKAMLQRAFEKIDHCFKTKGFTTLVMAGIGQGVFASLAGSLGIDNKRIFNELFTQFFHGNPNVVVNYDNWVEDDGVLLATLNRRINNDLRSTEWLQHYSQAKLDTTLFVNAWDPFSILGNGNAADGSADGYWGRISAISVIGWPRANKCLTREKFVRVAPLDEVPAAVQPVQPHVAQPVADEDKEYQAVLDDLETKQGNPAYPSQRYQAIKSLSIECETLSEPVLVAGCREFVVAALNTWKANPGSAHAVSDLTFHKTQAGSAFVDVARKDPLIAEIYRSELEHAFRQNWNGRRHYRADADGPLWTIDQFIATFRQRILDRFFD